MVGLPLRENQRGLKKAADPKTDGEVLSAINRLKDQYQSAKFEQHFKVDNAADDEP